MRPGARYHMPILDNKNFGMSLLGHATTYGSKQPLEPTPRPIDRSREHSPVTQTWTAAKGGVGDEPLIVAASISSSLRVAAGLTDGSVQSRS